MTILLSLMGLLETIIYFLLALGLLVAIHEAGHFFMARFFGVKVTRFSIGFGRAIWRRLFRECRG